MIVLVLAKIMGFLKLRLIAQLFGATRELDMFWAAFTIPDMLINILIVGSVNAAIIPIFSKVLHERGQEYLYRLFHRLNNLVFVLTFFVSCIAFIFADQIGNLLVGEYFDIKFFQTAEDVTSQDLRLLTWLIRVMLLSPIFLGLSSILSAYLQVFKKFLITALTPLIYNVVIIFAALVLVRNFGMDVEGVAWAVVIGSLGHLVFQIPIFVKLSKQQGVWKQIQPIKEDFKEIMNIIRLAVPRVIAVIGEQINVFVNILISLTLAGGALSTYKFAYSLHLFPAQIVGGAISLVALPNLSDAYSQGKMNIFREIYNKALQRALFLILPTIAIVVVLRLPIVRLAYGVGEFDWWSTVITSWCLFLFSLAILGQILASLSLRAFYAIHETKWPLVIILLTIGVNILGSIYFTNFFSHYTDWRPIVSELTNGGDLYAMWESLKSMFAEMSTWITQRGASDAAVGGLALSLSVAFMFESIFYIIVLHRKIQIISWQDTIKPFLQKVFCSLIMLVVMYIAFRYTDFSLDTTQAWNVLVILVLTSLLGSIVYLGLCKLLGVKELDVLWGYSKKFSKYVSPKEVLTNIPIAMNDYSAYFRIKIGSIFNRDGNGKKRRKDKKKN